MTASINDVELLPRTTKSYTFTASDTPMSHGKYWVNGFGPMWISICCFIVGVDWLYGLFFAAIAVAVFVIFLPMECSRRRPTCHTISCNDQEGIITFYRGVREIHSCPYQEFLRLDYKLVEKTYTIFWWICCCFRCGCGHYCGGEVYLHTVHKIIGINTRLCLGEENQGATSMITEIHAYFRKMRGFNSKSMMIKMNPKYAKSGKKQEQISAAAEYVNNSKYAKYDDADNSPFIDGTYSGSYRDSKKYYDINQFQMAFRNGMVTGSGSDNIGDYNIRGIYAQQTRRMAFVQVYSISPGDNLKMRLEYDANKQQFKGKWYGQEDKYESDGQSIKIAYCSTFKMSEEMEGIVEEENYSEYYGCNVM